jgi:hypothetical protein
VEVLESDQNTLSDTGYLYGIGFQNENEVFIGGVDKTLACVFGGLFG